MYFTVRVGPLSGALEGQVVVVPLGLDAQKPPHVEESAKESFLLCAFRESLRSHLSENESFYLRRSRQIRERKALFFFFFFLLLGGDHFSVSHVQFFGV